jgi:hypothetical protein
MMFRKFPAWSYKELTALGEVGSKDAVTGVPSLHGSGILHCFLVLLILG